MGGKFRENVGNRDSWIRIAFMVLFVIAFNVTEAVIVAVVVFQGLSKLITGETNERLREFGASLGLYLRDIVAFLAYHREERPFPFTPWPKSASGASTPSQPKPRRKSKLPAKTDSETPPAPGPAPGPDDATEGAV